MELVHEFDFQAALDAPLSAGAGPFGTRVVIPVTGGTVTGERINGSITGGGGDWVLIGGDGYARLDVRAQVRTGDQAVLYVSYPGILELTERVMTAVATMSEETAFEDHYFRTTPRLETGDERYAWVNHTLFVARGRLVPGAVAYEVFRVT